MKLAVLFPDNLSLKRKLEQRITFATAKKSKIFGSRKSNDLLGKVKSKSNKNNNNTP
jgi:hypothetical protein